MNKKRIVFGLLSFFLPIFLVFGGLLFFLLLLTSTSDTSKNDCIQPSINNPTDATDTPKSIEQFVKSIKMLTFYHGKQVAFYRLPVFLKRW